MDLKKFLINQKIEMEKFKWIKGCQIGKDPKEDAVKEWVEKYAKKYREEYNVVYEEMIHKVSKDAHEKLKEKFPTVSDEIFEFFIKTVIDIFTENWTKDVVLCENKSKKSHLEEI